MAARDVSRDQIAVPRQRFGRAGHHEVGAQGQRLLAKGRRGGVVDDKRRTPAPAVHRQPVQVDDIETGIGRCLREHHVGVGRCGTHRGARRLDDRDPLWRKVFLGIAANLVVAVGRHHKFAARLGKHPQHRRDSGHPGTEHQRRRGSLEFGERRLQLPPGRIRVTPVLVERLCLVGRQMKCRREYGR